jgi:phytol kinase
MLNGVVAALAASTWLAIAVALAAFLLLLAALQACAEMAAVRPEITRKLFHTGSGLLTLMFPLLFHEAWPVLLLTGTSALIVASAKFVPAVRARFGEVAGRVERTTFGELYFPLAVALLFVLTLGEDPLLFVVPVLVLTLADTASAFVGIRYGQTLYAGGNKSLEGSAAFGVVAFLCVYVPLAAWAPVGPLDAVLVAATLALLVMLLEGSARRGRDNLVIPLAGYFLLRGLLALDTAALLARLAVAAALVFLIALCLPINSSAGRRKPRGGDPGSPMALHTRA